MDRSKILEYWNRGCHFLYLGTLQYMGTHINDQWLAKFWGPINSYQVSEFLDQHILFKGHHKCTLEYGSVSY